MKILFPIASFYPAQNGGPSNSVYWLAKALDRSGVNVEIQTTDEGISSIPKNILNNKSDSKVNFSHRLFDYFPIRMLYESCVSLSKSDVVHLNSLFYPVSTIIAVLALLKSKKIIWSTRGELDFKALEFNSWKKKPVLRFVKIFLKKNIVFHATSEKERNEIISKFGKKSKIMVIPNMMELEPATPIYNKVYFLFIGRIHPIKGIDLLLEGLALSGAFRSSKFILKIAGDYNNLYYSELLRLVTKLGLENKVEFVGHKKDFEKQELYAGAFFTFLPSHSENFGNVVIESLSQGTPVVASTATPWKILEDSEAGFWIDNSPAEIGKVVDKILNMTVSQYADLKYNSLKLVKENFDIHRNIHLWVDAYNQILSEV